MHDESGFTLVELLVVCTVTVILMTALAMILGLGLQTSKTSSATLSSQTEIIVALDRLDYEARCASQATRISSGAGVTLTFPTQCTHATGTVTWCVSSGSLIRYSGSACSGSGMTLTTGITSATPFTCVATVGNYPALRVALTVNDGTSAASAASGSDLITLHNAPLVTSSSAACT
jgi:type II secretory pathway pseudopilin PulG